MPEFEQRLDDDHLAGALVVAVGALLAARLVVWVELARSARRQVRVVTDLPQSYQTRENLQGKEACSKRAFSDQCKNHLRITFCKRAQESK